MKNAKHFSEMISSEVVSEQEVMVSFDVQSLFTNVPIDKALEVINRRLTEDGTLEDRSTLTPGQITMLLGGGDVSSGTTNSSTSKQKGQQWAPQSHL